MSEIRLAEIAAGPGKVKEILGGLISREEPFLAACDAKTEADLAVLAEAGEAFKDKLVLAGSAGLADPLAARLAARLAAANPALGGGGSAQADGPKGPALFFGGSASTSLRAQLRRLAEADGASLVTLDLERLMEGPPYEPEALIANISGANPPHGPLVFNLPEPVEGAPPRWSSRAIAEAFGRLAAGVIKASSANTVFLSGGDTAREVLKALGVADMEIRSELSPGVVHLASGRLSLLTKSGGFGPPELLSELWRSRLAPGA